MAEGIELRMNVKGADKVQRELKQTGRAAKTMGGGMAGASAAASGLAAMLNPVALVAAAAAASLVLLTGGAVGAAVALKKTFSATLGLAKNLDEIGKKAKSIGASAEGLQVMIGAFELSGISSDKAIKSLQKLNIAMGETMKATPVKTYTDAFAQIGLEGAKLAKMPLKERMQAIAAGLETLGTKAEQASVASILFGRSGKDMLTGFENREALEAMIEDMESFDVASNEAVRNSEELQDAILRMNKAMFGLKTNALEPLIPVLTGYANGIAQVTKNMDKNDARAFGDKLADVAAGPFLLFLFKAETGIHRMTMAMGPAIKMASILAGAPTLRPLETLRKIRETTRDIITWEERARDFDLKRAKELATIYGSITKARREAAKPVTGRPGVPDVGGDGGGTEVESVRATVSAVEEIKDEAAVKDTRRLDLLDRLREKMAQRDRERQAALAQGSIDAAQASFSAVSTFANLAAEHVARTHGERSEEAKKAAKDAFAVGQAMALAQAIVSTAASIATAAIGPPGLPWSAPAMVAAGISGAAQIATIVGTTIQGVGHAGIPPGARDGLGMDNMPVLMQRNEMILDPVGTAAISSMLQARANGGENVTVNTVLELDGQVLGQTVDTHLIRSTERGLGYQERVRY